MKKIFRSTFLLLTVMVVSVTSKSQQVSVSLQVDYKNEVTVFGNSPVLLIVTVSNREARQAKLWNRDADQYLSELKDELDKKKISKEEYDARSKLLLSSKKEMKTISLGSLSQPWSSMVKWEAENKETKEKITLPVYFLSNPSPELVAELNGGSSFCFFGIDPGQLQKIKAGGYKLFAVIESSKSEPVILKIQTGKMPKNIEESEEQLINTARYYWHANKAEEGLRFVNRVLQKDQNSLYALSMRGDLYFLQKNYSSSLDDYNKALKIYYKNNSSTAEAPEYLLDMIAVVKERMEAK